METDERYARFMREFCDVLEVALVDVLGTGREHGPVLMARHGLIYVLRRRFGLSYPALGRLTKRDHTTCMSSCKRFGQLIAVGDRVALALLDVTGNVGQLLPELESPLDTLRRCTAEAQLEAVGS